MIWQNSSLITWESVQLLSLPKRRTTSNQQKLNSGRSPISSSGYSVIDSIYVAVLTAKHPHRIQNLMGYQALIVEACLEYGSETWLGYNRCFRQLAAASLDTTWAKIDPALWNMAFTGQAKARRCKFCFSLTHPSEDCDWAPIPSSSQHPTPPSIRGSQRQCNLQICYFWNHSPDPNCAYPNYKYQHVCLYCAKDPQATNRDHKAHKAFFFFLEFMYRTDDNGHPGMHVSHVDTIIIMIQ